MGLAVALEGEDGCLPQPRAGSSHRAGSVGLLGENYPGYFEAGDTRRLAELLTRAETDPEFLGSLKESCRKLAPLFEPARETAAWAKLIAEIFDPHE